MISCCVASSASSVIGIVRTFCTSSSLSSSMKNSFFELLRAVVGRSEDGFLLGRLDVADEAIFILELVGADRRQLRLPLIDLRSDKAQRAALHRGLKLAAEFLGAGGPADRKSTRLNSSH